MKNIPVGDIKPKDDEDDVQVINQPSSSNVPQDGEKDGRVENEDTHISYQQMVVQAQDVDAPQPPPQVVNRRNTPLLQDCRGPNTGVPQKVEPITTKR